MLLLLLALAAAPLAAESVQIEHDHVSCLVAGKYPEIQACFDPAESVARARVYFRAAGTQDWFYVDMSREATCFLGVLPRPSGSIEHVDYYVSATDREFVEARTVDYAPLVVERESDCDGAVARYLGSASVVVGTLSGAGVPAGFVGGGVLGLGLSTTTVAVIGAGVAGGAAVDRGRGRERAAAGRSPPLSPRGQPFSDTHASAHADADADTDTHTHTTPTPTPTPPLPAGCLPDDSAAPRVTILQPANGGEVGAEVEIVAEVTDPGPISSGIAGVTVFAEEQGGSRTVPIATLAPAGPVYRVTWTLPACLGPGDRWYIHVQATDRCEKADGARVRVKRKGDSCDLASAASQDSRGSVLWTSELTVGGGQGQVIVNGSQVVLAGAGSSPLTMDARPARTRVDATLLSGDGEGGVWRFSLASGRVKAGTLRVLSGDPVALGPGVVAFALAGRPGERVAFSFDVE